jgi:hypothetical protein
MKYKPVRDCCCQNEKCQDYRKLGEENIIRTIDSTNLDDIGDNFLVVFHVFASSGPSREVFVDLDFVTTVA